MRGKEAYETARSGTAGYISQGEPRSQQGFAGDLGCKNKILGSGVWRCTFGQDPPIMRMEEHAEV